MPAPAMLARDRLTCRSYGGPAEVINHVGGERWATGEVSEPNREDDWGEIEGRGKD